MNYLSKTLSFPIINFILLFPFAGCRLQPSLLVVDQHLQMAQNKIDSSQYEQALKLVGAAEELILGFNKMKDLYIENIYSMKGIVFLKIAPDSAQTYFDKLKNTDIPIGTPNQAHKHFFFGTFYLQNGNIDQAIEEYMNALALYDSHFNMLHANVVRTYSNLGLIMANKNQFLDAFDYYNKAIDVGIKYGGKSYPVLTHPYNNIGLLYMYHRRLKEALTNYLKSFNIKRKTFNDQHPELVPNYINIGLIYTSRFELDIALGYYQKALNISLKNDKKEFLPYIYNNMAMVYSGQKKYDKARELFNLTLKLESETHPPNHPELAATYYNIATTYLDNGQYYQGREYCQKALEFAKPEFPAYAYLIKGLGLSYMYEGDLVKAKDYFFQLLQILEEIHTENSQLISDAYFNLASATLLQKNYTEAISWNQKVQKNMRYFGNGDFRNVSFMYNLSKALLQENQILWSMSKNNVGQISLKKTIASCQETISAYEHLAKSYNDTKSKRELLESVYSAFEIAIASCHTSGTPINELGFQFAEQSKAILIREALLISEALHFSGIPDSLLSLEEDLRTEKTILDLLYQEKIEQGYSDKDSIVTEIAKNRFEIDEQYKNLLQILEGDYLQYFKAKHDLSTIPLEEVQQELLQPNQTMLEYMVGDSSIFLFLIQPDTFEVHEIKHDFPLDSLVQQMAKEGIYGYNALSLYDPKRTTNRKNECDINYTQTAQLLYQKLVAPVAEHLTEHLIIIPDGVLGYVPFEALLSGKPNKIGRFGDYPFMVKGHQISYCYSATLLKEMRDKQHRGQPSGQLLAMAPFFDGDVSELTARMDSTDLLAGFALRDSLGTLPGSGEEVAAVNKLWNGTSIIGDGASLAEFQQRAADYRILHLSTHGKADDRVGDYAYLAFGVPGQRNEFDKLYARDLYNYSLNADLVVLSACETGIGKLQKGEGIVSLARAFAYAGAKSIFPTLWQVNDAKTKELMIGFHTYLKMGKPKDEALRLAKLDFLESNKGQGGYDHPFFWAGMIGIGDMGAVD